MEVDVGGKRKLGVRVRKEGWRDTVGRCAFSITQQLHSTKLYSTMVHEDTYCIVPRVELSLGYAEMDEEAVLVTSTGTIYGSWIKTRDYDTDTGGHTREGSAVQCS